MHVTNLKLLNIINIHKINMFITFILLHVIIKCNCKNSKLNSSNIRNSLVITLETHFFLYT